MYSAASVDAPATPALTPPAAKKNGRHGLKIKWLFSSNKDSESELKVPVSTTIKKAKISAATPTPTVLAGTLPEWEGIQIDSSHRPPMSGELEGIVFVVEAEEMKEENDVAGGEGGRDGLWITLTPTTMSSSPFFDTLLVLVVSPLVTLSVVYGQWIVGCFFFVCVWLTLPTALLLVRSMIRRRRWRAPKSVVDRLPVRTYQSIPTTTATSNPSSSTLPSRQTPTQPQTSRSSPLPPSGSTSQGPGVERKDVTEGSKEEVPRRSRYMGGSVECVVCLEEYVDGVSRVMRLPCGHEFHANCMFVSPLPFFQRGGR